MYTVSQKETHIYPIDSIMCGHTGDCRVESSVLASANVFHTFPDIENSSSDRRQLITGLKFTRFGHRICQFLSEWNAREGTNSTGSSLPHCERNRFIDSRTFGQYSKGHTAHIAIRQCCDQCNGCSANDSKSSVVWEFVKTVWSKIIYTARFIAHRQSTHLWFIRLLRRFLNSPSATAVNRLRSRLLQ